MLKNYAEAGWRKCLFSGAMFKPFVTIAAVSLCFLFSCNRPKPDADLKRRVDSIELQAKAKKMAQEMMARMKDSVANAGGHEVAAREAINYGPCPAAIKTCAVVNDLRGGKAIVISLKNVSGKKIGSVKLSWTVYNKAGKALGSSAGMAKKELVKGKTNKYSWEINAPNGTRGKASVAGIYYKDGTKWLPEGTVED
jgi:hypothetical protein